MPQTRALDLSDRSRRPSASLVATRLQRPRKALRLGVVTQPTVAVVVVLMDGTDGQPRRSRPTPPSSASTAIEPTKGLDGRLGRPIAPATAPTQTQVGLSERKCRVMVRLPGRHA